MKFEFKLGSLIQFAVIASMLIAVGVITARVYSGLKRSILEGFDSKLKAISTVTAASIRGEDHDRLLAPKQIIAMTIDPADGQLFGVDVSFREADDSGATLVRIHPETGEAVTVAELAQAPISLTGSPKPGIAFGMVPLDDQERMLVEVDLKTGAIADRFSLPSETRSIAFDPSDEVLHAGGALKLLRIDLMTGTAEPVGGGGRQLGELARYSTGRLMAFESSTGQFLLMESGSGKVVKERFSAYRVTYDTFLREIRAMAPDLEPGQASRSGAAGKPSTTNAPENRSWREHLVRSQAMAFRRGLEHLAWLHPLPKPFLKHRILTANRLIARKLEQLSRINRTAGELARQYILASWRKWDRDLHEVLQLPLVDPEPRILAASDRLIRIDPDTLEWRDRWIWVDLESLEIRETLSPPGFRSEDEELYQRYVEPMRRIQESLDLKYHYTQTLSDTREAVYQRKKRVVEEQATLDRIIYGIDANTDEDHSAIGDVDTEEEHGESLEELRKVQVGGKNVHLTGILPSEKWGELKSGYAPIRYEDSTRRPFAGMAGADVSLETIRKKTKVALARVILTGLGVLIVASLLSVFVSRRLTGPIERMKDVALKIAAGQYGEQVKGSGLRELDEVSETFNLMSAALERSVSGLGETNRTWEADQRHYELIRHLTLRNLDLSAHDAWVELLHGGPSHHSASGWTNRGHCVAGWIVPGCGDLSANLSFRARTSALFYQLLESSAGDWNDFRNRVGEIFEDRFDLLFLADFKTGGVDFQVRDGGGLWTLPPGKTPRIEALTSGHRRIEPGTQYVVCSDIDLAKNLSRWSEDLTGELLPAFQVELGRSVRETTKRWTGITLSQHIEKGREDG